MLKFFAVYTDTTGMLNRNNMTGLEILTTINADGGSKVRDTLRANTLRRFLGRANTLRRREGEQGTQSAFEALGSWERIQGTQAAKAALLSIWDSETAKVFATPVR